MKTGIMQPYFFLYLGYILRTLEAAYHKAPHFLTVMPMLEKLILKSVTIAELNYKSIIEIDTYLDVKTEIILSSELDKENSLKGQDKVLHINQILNSNVYINAIGGRKLYDEAAFKEKGMELYFLQMGNVSYKQFNNEFECGLSIIDVLMFNTVEEIFCCNIFRGRCTA